MPYPIRALTAADVPHVAAFSLRAWAPVFASFRDVLGDEIYRRIYPDWRQSQTRAVTDTCLTHLDTSWVATADDEPAGFVVVIPDRPHNSGEIEMLAVDPAHQRHGIAAALLDHALHYLRGEGIALAGLGTGGDPGHAPARRAYERAGFTPIPLVRYYRVLTPAAP